MLLHLKALKKSVKISVNTLKFLLLDKIIGYDMY